MYQTDVSRTLTSNLLEITVQNTGVESSSTVFPNLFDTFYRAEAIAQGEGLS